MNDDSRPDPDELLSALRRREATGRRGRLKVFLGMSAGVGKTYAMLEAAHKARREGRDVVIGYVEAHGRPETDALTHGLESIPTRAAEHRGVRFAELDLDAVLARRPQLALVDELAHTNAPGSRHPKRWQDVLELIDAGIDVFATVNVQHVESRTDTVRQITGSTIYETVPDRVLDQAEIELVDLPPDELMRRLESGKVYQGERAEAALFNFFREGNLTALREIALRYAAGRVGRDVQDYLRTMRIDGPWKTGERLLVAVGGSPSSAELVRWTRRLADTVQAEWIAAHVESSNGAAGDQLTRNLELARELGAEVVIAADEDRVRGLLRIARQRNVTQLIVGKPAGGPTTLAFGYLRAWRLVRGSGLVDVHLVRIEPRGGRPARGLALPASGAGGRWRAYGAAVAAVAGVTLACLPLERWFGFRPVGLVYLFSVVTLALFLGRGPILAAASLSALAWDFFFLPPKYTLYITTLEDGMMFGMYFVVAIVLGQLVSRTRAQEVANLRREERATALYLLTRSLAVTRNLDEAANVTVQRIMESFSVPSAIWLADDSETLAAEAHRESRIRLSEKEKGAATWAFRHKQLAGRFTDSLPSSEALHVPLAAGDRGVGVLSLAWPAERPPTYEQRDLLDALARQCAVALDRHRLRDAEARARLAAESERLGKTLLNSVSHELRTPLAAIESAVNCFKESGPLNELQEKLVGEVSEAADRLTWTVRNLLDVARLEAGRVRPRLDWVDAGDLCHVAAKAARPFYERRPLAVKIEPGLPLVRMDFVLMENALLNLLANAAAHTPEGSPVTLAASASGGRLRLSVTDEGPGLGSVDPRRLFEKFYRAPGAKPGGIGLGLSIVKGLVEAQGGSVEASNQPGGGAAFVIGLPLGDGPGLAPESLP